jgi:glycosyltransferase involved in cell wall biosynthesis
MKGSPRPLVSIVIPTHNRAQTLDQCLNALAAQTYPAELVQIVVVADGCSDDTPAVVRRRPEGSILLIEQPPSGPATARNQGAARSTGELLIFLDDDMEASPGLVAAHVEAHKANALPSVVIGYCPARLHQQKGLYRTALLDWWELVFDTMELPARRFRYSDMLGGNVSVPKALFHAVGGFNADLWCHEDYELGLKLVDHGASFRFEPKAMTWHNERSDLRKAFRRKYDEGIADVQIGQLHPHIVRTLHLAKPTRLRRPNPARTLAFSPSPVRALGRATLWWALHVADAMQFRRAWRRLSDRLLEVHYWMGVEKKLGGPRAVRDFVAAAAKSGAEVRPSLTIDVADDLDRLEAQLDDVRPGELLIRYLDQYVGRVATEPGEEQLRGAYLRPLLGHRFADEMLRAMGAAVASGDVRAPTRHAARRAAASPAARRVGSNIVDI